MWRIPVMAQVRHDEADATTLVRGAEVEALGDFVAEPSEALLGARAQAPARRSPQGQQAPARIRCSSARTTA